MIVLVAAAGMARKFSAEYLALYLCFGCAGPASPYVGSIAAKIGRHLVSA